jgi:pimeloyl-ACP methyl ester carboxylesterase
VTGSGPARLLPKFNYSRWDRYLDVSLLAGRFTVVTASLRGFAASGRLAADGDYRVADLASDLVAVMEAAGFVRFSVFGHSFTGAFAPWLAHLTDRVDAVVSGGFPIAGDSDPGERPACVGTISGLRAVGRVGCRSVRIWDAAAGREQDCRSG